MPKIRVLLVEDSRTVRRRLYDVLAAGSETEVVGEAEDGKRAIELCRELRPDVVTLDMQLPIMNGLSVTEYVMAHCPTPILIVSASTNRGDLFKTYDALAAGAVDVLEKPNGDEVDGEWERRFLSAVKLVSRIKVIRHPRALLGDLGRARAALPGEPAAGGPQGSFQVLALGASTGGPGALVRILRAMPSRMPLPIFIVLHIDDLFSAAFAEWLESQAGHPVVPARGGESVAALTGKVVMAPPGRHLVVRGETVVLTSDPERHSCRPSIDVLFESLARDYGRATLACLLTGMGRDGAAGLLEIMKAGGFTIAQDEATSIVYGMPREAVLLGATRRVLPLGEIGPALVSLTAAGAELRE